MLFFFLFSTLPFCQSPTSSPSLPPPHTYLQVREGEPGHEHMRREIAPRETRLITRLPSVRLVCSEVNEASRGSSTGGEGLGTAGRTVVLFSKQRRHRISAKLQTQCDPQDSLCRGHRRGMAGAGSSPSGLCAHGEERESRGGDRVEAEEHS